MKSSKNFMPIQVLKKTNPFIKGSVFAVLPVSLFFIISALTEIVALSVVALLVLFCGAGIGAYYYSTKTKNKGIEKIGFVIIAIIFYISISSVFLIIIGAAATMLKDKAYTAEINSLISNLEKNNKEELLSFKQNKIFLSVENKKRLDQAILRIEQEEAKKAEQDAIERKKQEEAKKVEAEMAAKAKRIKEGYIDASGIITTTFFDPSEGDSSQIQKQPFTSVKTPDGTLTIKWTFTMRGDQGDLIRTVTFAPNASRSSKIKLEYLNFPEQNDEYEADHFEIISPTTIKDHTNRIILNFSSPFK
jgi:hypothetical protein